MSSLPILGVDIAKASFEVFLINEAKTAHSQFRNNNNGFTDLSRWLRKKGVSQVRVCLEATGSYAEPLAQYLFEQEHIVYIVNPVRIKAYAQSELLRNKTDRVDAALIARFCKQDDQSLPWSPPPREVSELQALMRHLEDLQSTRLQYINRLESTSKSNEVTDSLQEFIKIVDQQIEHTQELIDKHYDKHPDLRNRRDLLTTIPGIGEKTANVLLSEITRWDSYNNARQLAAYAGLTPKKHDSGTSVRSRSRLSKIGNARVRRALYLPAVVARHHNPIIKALSDRLTERGKAKMAIIGAAMRKLLHLAFGVLKTGKPFDPVHSSN
jgi:transposase